MAQNTHPAYSPKKPTLGSKREDFRDRLLPAQARARDLLKRLNFDELLDLTGGFQAFFTTPLKRFGLPAIRFSDASMGVRLDDQQAKKERTTSFPSSVALAATWNPALAREYGKALGEECRALGIGVLLGPGLNIYRTALCGRNFEYLGEDPLLTSRLAVPYVRGIQSMGVMACAKHFACNNHEWLRHHSDSVVDGRALREIYLPAFKAVIKEAGVMSVMTAYSLFNGEKASQNRALIEGILQKELGFENLVMSDWGGVWDGAKVLDSGQHLVMPDNPMVRRFAKAHPGQRKKIEKRLRFMASGVLRALFKMGFFDRSPARRGSRLRLMDHQRVALKTACQAVTLLKNDGLLPLLPGKEKNILLIGPAADNTPHTGGGSGRVAGWGHVTYLQGLRKIYGPAVVHAIRPSDAQLKRAGAVLVCPYVSESEGEDRWFEFPRDQEALIRRAVRLNGRTAVILTQGSGIRMTSWASQANAIVQAYFLGQCRGTALANVLSGRVSPGGKLPFSIERENEDSPSAGYVPEFIRRTGETRWISERGEAQKFMLKRGYKLPVRVEYKEGILVGYRWYDAKGLAPLFPFGHGLSYATFAYEGLKVKKTGSSKDPEVFLEFTLRNTGDVTASEVAQVYVSDPQCRLPRPPQELKAFARVDLKPGQRKVVRLSLDKSAFSFYDPAKKAWVLEPGVFVLRVGASSRDPRLRAQVRL